MLTKNPHYLIVGACSETGKALIQYMSNMRKIYSISDTKTNFFQNLMTKPLLQEPVRVFDSEIQDLNQLDGIDHIIIAPGVPRSISLLKEAKSRGIPVDTEIAFTFSILNQEKRTPTVLGITGSLGKSTTSFLLYEILKKGYNKGESYLLGNFGTPFIAEIDKIYPQDIVVLELSSYQLEDAEKYRINGTSILNVTPNHLDRYDSFANYQIAKEKIFLGQTTQDFTVLNTSLPQAQDWKKKIHGSILAISTSFSPDSIYSLDENYNIFHYQNLFLNREELTLKTPHILENMCVALAFSSQMGISAEVQKEVLRGFKGLEHRSEFVRELHYITFINDSKATTPFAIIPNLGNSNYADIVLIIGGKNKNLDFSLLNHHLQYTKYIVYYGGSGESIQKMISFSDSIYVYDFDSAVKLAYEKALEIKAKTVLLSPGCASFDQFTSYQERGKKFKTLVDALN